MDSLKKVPKGAWAGVGVLVLVIAAGVVLLSGSSSSSEDLTFTGSGYPGVDKANTRSVGGPIDTATVANLEVAWTLPLKAKSTYGSYSSSPVVSNGVIYSQDLVSDVQAISLESGEVLWEKNYNQPDQGPNGIVVADGHVYGATPTSAFALDQETGEEVWSTTLARNEHEGIDMAPGFHDGLVYVSTVPGTATEFYEGEGVGVLWALDAKTGKKKWHFNTVPDDLWAPGKEHINSGGGLWYPPSFDDKGFMYFGVGNPAPFPGTNKYPWGSSRPGPNLYTNSMVKLDAATGKMQWYYQLTPHDLYDWDFQDPPILLSAGGKDLAIGAGKSGIVVALDRKSGKVVWKSPVGKHNGHDNDPLYAMRGEYSKLKTPMTVFPGLLGGVIAPMAAHDSTIFVPVVNHSAIINKDQEEVSEGESMTGELVALDAATGTVKWNYKFPTAAFGAPTAVNDLVFQTTFDGTLYAFNADRGTVAWEASLPAGINTGVTVSGNTVIAPAGAATAAGQAAEIVAYSIDEPEQ